MSEGSISTMSNFKCSGLASDGRATILAEEAGEGRCDLGLRDGRRLAPLTERGRVGSENGEPDILRAGKLVAVAFPSDRTMAAAVVRRVNQRRLIVILWIRLQ